MESSRLTELLGWNSDKRIGYNICAFSELAACIDTDPPAKQSLTESILCLIDPFFRSGVGRAQLVRGCIRQSRQAVAIGSMIQQNFDALTNREKIHNLHSGGNVHAEMNSAVGRTLPTSTSICCPHRSSASLRSARKSWRW